MQKLKIPYAVVVEGKYDKIKLSAVIDAVIIVTNGFGVYKNRDTVSLLRYYAQRQGLIILTDSDKAGFRIRGHIKSVVPKGKIINLYAPEIFGKEKRKINPSKEGKLGVEGISVEKLRELFEKSGITGEKKENIDPITKIDLYQMGLSGHHDSSLKRKKILKQMELPESLTANALLEVVNARFSKKEFLRFVKSMKIDKS